MRVAIVRIGPHFWEQLVRLIADPEVCAIVLDLGTPGSETGAA